MHPFYRLRETRLLPVFVGLAIVAFCLILVRISSVLPPFIWAAITAYILFPLVARLERASHLPRVAVIALVYLALIGILVLAGFLIAPTVVDQVQSLAKSLPDLVTNARQELVREPQIRIAGFQLDTQQLDARIDVLAQQVAERFGREAVPLVLQTFELVIKVLVYLLATFYFLLQGDALIRRLQGLAPARHRKTVDRVVSQVNETIGAYIRAQIVLFAIMTVSTFTLLSILQVQYALVVAIATGLLELVPIVGPWAAGGIAVLMAVSQSSGPFNWSPTQLAVVVGICYLALRMIEDQVVIPQLVGRIVRIHPVLVIFGVLTGAALGGALGLVIAVPILAATKIISLAIYDELRHPPERYVVALREPGALAAFESAIEQHAGKRLVLLIVPGALAWDDLQLAQRIAVRAISLEIRLQVVTPDQIASSIATAAGIEVITQDRISEDAGLLTDSAEYAATLSPARTLDPIEPPLPVNLEAG
ncbi:MAG TPA: AI-2E family transporter [Nitrolancea sp.]|jgi:predicted PurR-regulated permease PerM|nr:AI-2E family transporter [Nitrolancea sp.]